MAMGYSPGMAGFIVLKDGRAYAAANWATDAVIRAIAAEVEDGEFRAWLLAQQSEFVGMGLTSVDLREVAPSTVRASIARPAVPTSGPPPRASRISPATRHTFRAGWSGSPIWRR
jgi:hypothetical protein